MTFIVYFITYFLLIATFFNDGFTGMLFSIPFLWFIAYDSVYSRNRKRIIFNSVTVFVLFILALTRFSNPFVYPVLNSEHKVSRDYILTHYPYSTQNLVEVDKIKRYFEKEESFLLYKQMDLYKEYVLKKDTLVKPVKVKITGHPDILGISYDLQIVIKDSNLMTEIKQYILTHNEDIGLDINSRLPKKLQNNSMVHYRESVPNKNNHIYEGAWYYDDIVENKTMVKKRITSYMEKYISWIVLIFNPMYIWIYLIILYFQYRYLKRQYSSDIKLFFLKKS